MNPTSGELYKAGKLAEALAAAGDEVKRRPTDSARRGLLAELLCFAGEWERADSQLDVLLQQDPKLAMGLTMLRQLIRAEQARQQFFAAGALPEFLDQPSPLVRLHLDASIRIREGKAQEAAELLQQAEAQRPKPRGTCNGKPFDDFRDLDDLLGPILEVLTSNGKYYWIPIERIERMEFHAPERPRDLLWRRVHMLVSDGPDGEVFLPVLYPGAPAEPDDGVRLGRKTDWRGGEGDASPVRGIGQRMFLVGDEGRSIMEFQEIVFQIPEAARGQAQG
jgi:type VI secretion system protein ImpE